MYIVFIYSMPTTVSEVIVKFVLVVYIILAKSAIGPSRVLWTYLMSQGQ